MNKIHKVFKYVGIGFIILLFGTIILSNIGKIFMSMKNKEYSKSLEGMIANVNQLLPQKAFDDFDFFIINRVSLERKCVVWDCTLDTTFFYPIGDSFLPESVNGGILEAGNRKQVLDIDTLLSNDLLKKYHHQGLLYYHLFARKNKNNPFYNEITKRYYSQKYRIRSPFSNRQCEYTMTYDEMKRAEQFCANYPDQALQEFLSEYLERQNTLLDIASNNSDVLMRMTDEDTTLVYHFIYDKSYSMGGNKPISNLREQYDLAYNALKKDACTLPIFFGLKEICQKTERKFHFRCKDWKKNDSLEFIIY